MRTEARQILKDDVSLESDELILILGQHAAKIPFRKAVNS